jgi:hypothetical protein
MQARQINAATRPIMNSVVEAAAQGSRAKLDIIANCHGQPRSARTPNHPGPAPLEETGPASGFSALTPPMEQRSPAHCRPNRLPNRTR